MEECCRPPPFSLKRIKNGIYNMIVYFEHIMSETIQQLNEAFTSWQTEDEKFTVKGNSAAGTRARKALQEIAKLVKARRAEISEEKNARKEAKD